MSCGAGSREQPGAGSCWAPASCSLCFAVSGEKAGQEKRGLRAAGGWCLLRAWAGGSRLCWQPVWGSSGEPCALRGLSWEGAGVRGVGAERRGKEEGCGGMEGQSEVCRGAKPGPGAASGAGREGESRCVPGTDGADGRGKGRGSGRSLRGAVRWEGTQRCRPAVGAPAVASWVTAVPPESPEPQLCPGPGDSRNIQSPTKAEELERGFCSGTFLGSEHGSMEISRFSWPLSCPWVWPWEQ